MARLIEQSQGAVESEDLAHFPKKLRKEARSEDRGGTQAED